ncbi:MAG: heme-copper oxidase subunit III family protein [Polyangiales bacterium]
MSSEHAEHHDAGPHPVGTETDEYFGAASDGKIGMWIFLLTDAFSFGGLLLTYAIMRAGADHWPMFDEEHGEQVARLGIPFTAVMTFVLLCSSVTMVLALNAAQNRNKKGLLTFLGLTILGGAFFLCGQAFEYHHLLERGLTLQKDHMMATFFMVTGFHGMHVLTGVIYMSVIWIQSLFGKYSKGDYNNVEIVGLFWHFVDLVWILVFTFIYLLPPGE